MSTMQFAALVLAHDPLAPTRVAMHIDLNADAANEDWQRNLDDDPGYLEWLETEAEVDNMRHARW